MTDGVCMECSLQRHSGLGVNVSRARCGILHAASQNRDPGFFEQQITGAPALQRTASRSATRCAASGARSYFPGGASQIFHSVDGPAWPWKKRCVVIASRSAPGAFASIHASQVGSR